MNLPGVLAIDLKNTKEWQHLRFAAATRLWLSKTVLQNEAEYANPLDTMVAISFGDPANQPLPWGLSDGRMNTITFAQPVTDLWVKVLAAGANAATTKPSLFLSSANGVTAGYVGNDGLSPQVGSGGLQAGG